MILRNSFKLSTKYNLQVFRETPASLTDNKSKIQVLLLCSQKQKRNCILDQTFSSLWECTTDADCIDDAVCSNNFCECSPGYTFSTNGYNCLKCKISYYHQMIYSRKKKTFLDSIGYGSSCEDDTQCGWLTGSYVCEDGGCFCGDGYRYFHGKCLEVKGLGETCIRDEDCHVSNYLSAMRCSDEKVCVCNEGFYPREDYDCRPEANGMNLLIYILKPMTLNSFNYRS